MVIWVILGGYMALKDFDIQPSRPWANAGQISTQAPANPAAQGASSEADKALEKSHRQFFDPANCVAISAADQKRFDEHIKKGYEFLDQKNYPAAIKEFEAAVELKPGDAGAHNDLGKSYYLNNEFCKAGGEFNLAIINDPKGPIAHANLALNYSVFEEYGSASFEYSQAISLSDNKDQKKEWRKKLDATRRLLKNQITRCEQKIKKNPNDVNTLIKLAHCYNDAKMHQKAIETSKKAIILDPINSNAYYELGSAYAETYNYIKAEDAFVLSLEYYYERSYPDLSVTAIYSQLGGVRIQLSDHDNNYAKKAINTLKDAFECKDIKTYDNCTVANFHFLLALAYDKLGDSESANKHRAIAKKLGYNLK